VLVCIDKKVESYPRFDTADVFTVNFLSVEQRDVSQHFAKHGGDKFSGLAWQRGVLGAPILTGGIGHVECRIKNGYDGGDHTIYVGEIEAGDSNDGAPLLHFRHAYHRADRA
jgi:flavin reductase (DIM6/NTAB) family NADH-FMN oxidoreductase RutF